MGKQCRPRSGAILSGPILFVIPSASFGRIILCVKPACSNFRMITAIFLGVQILGFLRYLLREYQSIESNFKQIKKVMDRLYGHSILV